MTRTRWLAASPGPYRRGLLLFAGFCLLALVGTLDWITSADVDFSLFYLLPVCFVTWKLNRRLGYVMSVCSAIVWLCDDRFTGARSSAPLVATWNMSARLLFFAASVSIVNRWKNEERQLSLMVEERTATLRRLATQLSTTEAAERRKLAYDMHDAVSQTLSMVKMNLDSAQIDAEGRRALHDRLADCAAMVEDVIQQCRTLMFDLHPTMLDDLGLLPTLNWYATDFTRRTGVELLVSESGPRLTLSAVTANYLYRAVKELAGNALRHGRAGTIIVTMHWEPAGLRLVVDDDGGGFDGGVDAAAAARESAGSGFGLAGIDERVRSMGGSVLIESTRGQGSRIIIEVPVDRQGAIDAAQGAAGRGSHAGAVGHPVAAGVVERG